ncbi:MAG: glutaminyl-peptide cyclotransferase [Anaerolineae bacterium]|nr:glutaminyl-peptide cyclotransferase [Anaerolineae bacterium]
MTRRLILLLSLVIIGSAAATLLAFQPAAPTETLELLVPEVISVRPHDTSSYTQGLLLYNGYLYESAGQEGESDVRKVDPLTGEVLQKAELNAEIFAEGLALVDDQLIQLTWKNGYAFVYDRETFDYLKAFQYFGEGWGLCYDGGSLWMSNGSSNLYMLDPETFGQQQIRRVTLLGLPIDALNELECVGDAIYANIYLTDRIVRIDKATGNVTGVIDAAGLLTPEESALLSSGEVLNGIAYDAENDTFLITGKHWPKLFEVRFTPVSALQSVEG